jgi:histidinol-phosphate aminotransferase
MELNEAISLINERVRGLSMYHLEPKPARIKLNQNENPYDWPFAIKEEIASFCKERPWNRYPNFVPEALKRKLSEYTGVDADGIIVANGSNEILLVLMLSLLRPGTTVVICQPTFTVYRLLANGLGGREKTVFLNNDFGFDVEGIRRALSETPQSVCILCSPNNPTGSMLTEADIRSILGVHTGILILDQAYVEFGGFNAIPLLNEYPNLIITRTFSKAMGGAGLRLGYLLGARGIVGEINKIKLPYNINFFSEHVAETLLSHAEYVRMRVKEISEARDGLYEFFRSMPFDNVYPSGANFMVVRLKRKNELFAHLLSLGILVRDVSSYPMLENCLRINAGTCEENGALKQALQSFFTEAPNAYNLINKGTAHATKSRH